MSVRTMLKSVKFNNPFWLNGVDSILPAGTYLIETDEEAVAEIPFEAYRRVRTTITILTKTGPMQGWEVCTIEPQDLEATLSRDLNATEKSDAEQFQGRAV